MKIKETEITLPEGRFLSEVIHFESKDDNKLSQLYKDWRSLCSALQSFQGRGVNLPEALSESAFCRAMNTVRLVKSILGANTSFDVYDLERKKRIQVKACSVLPDLTSFGPKSVWDEIYFCDFYRNGRWDGKFDIYLIPNDLIYNHKVNANQTMKQQQKQGRRPRFSIYKEIIQENSIEPVKTYQL